MFEDMNRRHMDRGHRNRLQLTDIPPPDPEGEPDWVSSVDSMTEPEGHSLGGEESFEEGDFGPEPEMEEDLDGEALTKEG